MNLNVPARYLDDQKQKNDDDDDDELFCGMVGRRKAFNLFPAGTIVRDPHHLESPTRHEQDLIKNRRIMKQLAS